MKPVILWTTLLALAPGCGFAAVTDIVNSIRSQGCAGMPALDRPVIAQSRLDQAAKRLAQQDSLDRAIGATGYRAKKSASINIRSPEGDDAVGPVLRERFCDTVADPDFHEVGVYRRGDETWIVLAAPLSPPESENAAAASRRVLELVNDARSRGHRCGRRTYAPARPLEADPALQRAAREHADDMAANNFHGHRGSDGSRPADRATRARYAWAAVAENVAAGQTTAAEVVERWLSSPGHCENLMNPRYTETGAARAVNPESDKAVYWVQVFGAPK